MALWRMRIACWITTATNTHSEYVILIAFLRQQWLHERASILCLHYIACLIVHILLTSTMKRIKSVILEKNFSAELQIIIASYNIVQIYTLRICHIQRPMKREDWKCDHHIKVHHTNVLKRVVLFHPSLLRVSSQPTLKRPCKFRGIRSSQSNEKSGFYVQQSWFYIYINIRGNWIEISFSILLWYVKYYFTYAREKLYESF
jgi:hypothetical protein